MHHYYWNIYFIVIFVVSFFLLYPSIHDIVFSRSKTYFLKRKILKLSTFKDLYKNDYSDKNFNIPVAYAKTIVNFEAGLREFIDSNGEKKDLIKVSCYDLIVLHNLPLREIIKARRYLDKKMTIDNLKEFLNDMTTPTETDIIGTLLFVESFK